MRKPIFAILEEVAQFNETEDDVAQSLRENDCPELRCLLDHVFNPNIKFLLPEGPLPPGAYRPSDFDEPFRFYHDMRKLYLFVEGAGPAGLKQRRREELFIELLSSVHPRDAEILVAMKDKKTPYKNITAKAVKKAFPGLLP